MFFHIFFYFYELQKYYYPYQIYYEIINIESEKKTMTEFITENEFSQEGDNMDFDQMLDTNKKTKANAKTKKTNAEILSVPAEVQVKIDSLLNAKKAKKTAESDIKKAEPSIIEHGITLKDEKAFSGSFQKSYKLGNEDSHVNMVTANKWSFKEDDIDQIKEIIGENADDLVVKETEVRLKPEVFKDPELKQKFVQMVGMDFPEFFETHVYHHVSEDFDEKVYDLGEESLEDLRLLMKQSKPSLR